MTTTIPQVQSKVEITNAEVTSTVGSGLIEQKKTATIKDFYLSNSVNAYYDSGMMPVNGSGIVRIRKALGQTQITYQYEAGKYHVIWGDKERDNNAVTYYLAQPYRIVVADFVDNALVGAKHYYTTRPLISEDDQLYLVNLPNTNITGYSGKVALGWICLYKNGNAVGTNDAELGAYVARRCSGEEPYNNRNMSSCDGTRYYQGRGKPKRTWDPVVWQEHTTEHGVDWVFEDDLWIPAKVRRIDDQTLHTENGKLLTYGMAIHGTYYNYYSESNPIKPFNLVSRDDLANKNPDKLEQAIFSKIPIAIRTKPTIKKYIAEKPVKPAAKEKVTFNKQALDKAVSELEKLGVSTDNITKALAKLNINSTEKCASCNEESNVTEMQSVEGGLACKTCKEKYYIPVDDGKYIHFEQGVYITEQNKFYSVADPKIAFCNLCAAPMLVDPAQKNQGQLMCNLNHDSV